MKTDITKTIKNFVTETTLPEKLVRSVIRQMGGFDVFKENAKGVCEHGADSGFNGFIWYDDTVKFTKNNKKEILEVAKQQANEFGMSLSEMIAGFNYVTINQDDVSEAIYNNLSQNQQEIYNVLAWYALEEVSRSYSDLLENSDQND